jgi:signal transduction histidine kinase
MEIEDDGTGTVAGPGNGLRGLQERLTEVGGTIHAAPRAQGGFLVRAESA